ncbi:hypothetical protein [Anabaena sp. CCY 9910]|uniref:hypothetical protein n=1 Tax=Anabaena sp. CCY 9910 TaxID=3103870 RepID=UPI0039E0C851
MNLDEMITQAYNQHQAQLKMAEEARLAHEKKLIEQSISAFKQKFDRVISDELQKVLGIEIVGSESQSLGHAQFGYMGYYFRISAYGADKWRVDRSKNNSCFECLFADYSSNLVDRLLIALGEARESAQPQPGVTIEDARLIFENCLSDLEKVFDSRDDLTSNLKFGESLQSAIDLVDYCLDDLSGDEEG